MNRAVKTSLPFASDQQKQQLLHLSATVVFEQHVDISCCRCCI